MNNRMKPEKDPPQVKPVKGVGVIIERDGKILLGLRKGGRGAGTWGPPGGTLEDGETYESAAIRETFEETGLRVTFQRLDKYVGSHMFQDGFRCTTGFVWANCPEGEPRITEPDKCGQWRWFSWDRLPRQLFEPFQAYIAR